MAMGNIAKEQEVRTTRALAIAKTKRIVKRGSVWIVPSQSHSGSYVVSQSEKAGMPTWECTCPDYETRGQPCKHVIAVEIVRHRQMPDEIPATETKRVTYAQDWPAYNAAQVHEKECFALLLRDLSSRVESPPQEGRGRPRLPLRDVIYGCATKVYSRLCGRRAQTDIRRNQAAGLSKTAPHYNTLFRYMADPALTPILHDLLEQSALPMVGIESNFAVDSTGFANSTYSRWLDQKYGAERKVKTWVKVHAVCGVKTQIVTSAIITDMSGADSPQFRPLIEATAKNFKLGDVVADKAYLSRENVAAVDRLGGVPFIPFKEGTGDGLLIRGERAPHARLWKRLYHHFQYDREKFLQHYHARSNIESCFSMIKAKFGASISSKCPTSQHNEALVKLLCHNVVVLVGAVFELGLQPSLAVD
jgi:transposase